jgi:hypothetical protein
MHHAQLSGQHAGNTHHQHHVPVKRITPSGIRQEHAVGDAVTK